MVILIAKYFSVLGYIKFWEYPEKSNLLISPAVSVHSNQGILNRQFLFFILVFSKGIAADLDHGARRALKLNTFM